MRAVFHRNTESIQARLAGNDEVGFLLTLTMPDGTERAEHYQTSARAYVRWLELLDFLGVDGWVQEVSDAD